MSAQRDSELGHPGLNDRLASPVAASSVEVPGQPRSEVRFSHPAVRVPRTVVGGALDPGRGQDQYV